MNLLFCIDRNFIPLLTNCIRSVIKSGTRDHYQVYILHSDLEEADCERIRADVGEQAECHFVFVDQEIFSGFPETKRYPAQIYYRLAAPLLLPETLDRILYLDVDTVIINPLDGLYDMDFEGNYFLACTHTRKFLTDFNRIRLGVRQEVPYVNTGVMVYNLAALREAVRLEDIRDFADRKMRMFLLPDQDILTALYGEKVKLVDTMRYNLSDRILAFNNADPRKEKVDLDWVRANGVVIHYCGKNKPWKPTYNGILDTFYKESCVVNDEFINQ